MLTDDVDCALVVREFRRRYHVPSHYVDDAVREQTTKQFAGDRGRLVADLRRQGASLEDFRRYIEENMIIRGMLSLHTRQHPGQSLQGWLTGLRQKARVERLPALQPTPSKRRGAITVPPST